MAFRDWEPAACEAEGLWGSVPARARLGRSPWPYMPGQVLQLEAVLGRPAAGAAPDDGVELISRTLKPALEREAEAAFARFTDGLRTSETLLSDEVRWLTGFRDTGWSGPADAFWRRYAVLTSLPKVAPAWLDDRAQAALMNWPGGVQTNPPPVMLAWAQGRLLARLALPERESDAIALHGLALLDHLLQRASELTEAPAQP